MVKFGIPLGCGVSNTLSRNRVADSLAHKVIGKLGGSARWTLAATTPKSFAGRSMLTSLSEHALLVGVDFSFNDAYASVGDRSAVGVMIRWVVA